MRPTDVTPMKMEWVDVDPLMVGESWDHWLVRQEALLVLLANDDWVAEQKFDGTRVMARIGGGRIDFVGMGGSHMTQSAVTQWLPRLRAELLPLATDVGYGDEWVLDGEVLVADGTYVVYDFPLGHRSALSPECPLSARRAALEGLMLAGGFSSVCLAPQARGRDAKLALLRRVMAEGAEGLVFKRLDGEYRPGKRVTDQLKVKLVKTVDCVVTARDVDGGKNARLAMYGDDGLLVEVGGCSMIGKPDARPGEVVEVRYLYWTGHSLYQPRMVKIREDRSPASCLLSQLTPVTKEVLTA